MKRFSPPSPSPPSSPLRPWRSRPPTPLPPEVASGVAQKPAVHAKRQMVVAANPYAADAGIAVLRDGGNAADALVAVQAMLGLVEPQSSGSAAAASSPGTTPATSTLTTFDARETAPAAATPQSVPRRRRQAARLLRRGGRRPLGRRARHAAAARNGAQALRQEAVGRSCSQPAIELSESGFRSRRGCNTSIAEDVGRLDQQPATRAYFFDAAGAPLAAGHGCSRNQPYAETLQAIAARRRRRVLQGQDRRRYRGGGHRPSDQSGRPQPRRPRRLPGQGAAGRLRALSRLRGLRHGTALLRRADDRPDPRHGRAVRHRDARPGRSREPGASSATRPASPSPTASATSPTAIS